MERLLLKVREAADLLGISISQCYDLAAGRVIPSIRLGTSVRIPRRELEDWIATHTEAALAGEQWAAEKER